MTHVRETENLTNLNDMKDSIIHTTTSRFKIMDSIRILLGKEVIITSTIETDHEKVRLTGNVKNVTIVTKLFPSKREMLKQI